MELDTVTDQRNKPGLRATKKLWWAKEITPDYHVAGGLIERWIKYASEGGFKSLVSLFSYNAPRKFGSDDLPSSSEARRIAEGSGLQYVTVLNDDESNDWCSVKTIEKMMGILSDISTPVLMFCDEAYKVAFVSLLSIAKKMNSSTTTGQITSEKFYRIATGLGFDYTMDCTKKVVSEVIGEPLIENPTKPDTASNKWSDYWLAHYVYENWYTAGQIRSGHIKEIGSAGFKSVVNMRQGVTTDNTPSQEIVTLLNVTDDYPTYGKSELGPRQDQETLQNLVIDPNRDSTYISDEAKCNFENRNVGEFGDQIGYNEDIEKEEFEKAGFPYYHMPVGDSFSPELFGKYKKTLLELGKSGPVLVHCASARRVAYLAVLAAAIQHDKDLQWALKRAKEIGFEVTMNKTPDIYEMFCAWLDEESKFSLETAQRSADK